MGLPEKQITKDKNEAENENLAPLFGESRWVIDNLPFGVFSISLTNNQYILSLTNKFFEDSLSSEIGDWQGQIITKNNEDEFSAKLFETIEKVLDHNKFSSFEYNYGEELNEKIFQITLIPKIENNEVIQILGTLRDDTKHKHTETFLRHRSHHDPLTELPNQIKFLDLLEETLKNRETQLPHTHHIGIIRINVDKFQRINEAMGNVAGDEFLNSFAARMKYAIRTHDTLSRFNADEFVCLINDVESNSDLVYICDRMQESLMSPFVMGNVEFYSSACIGYTSTIESNANIEALLGDSDTALHIAKAKGRGQTSIHQKGKRKEAKSKLMLEIELKKALDNKELELFYQPIICLKTGALKEFEALTRWNHPSKGVIMPDNFIPIAEETGLIVELGRWALITACNQLSEWQKKYPEANDLRVAVNISNAQFLTGNVAQDAAIAVKNSGISGRSLKVEITETVIMENPRIAAEMLYELKESNIGIALDDFGTGYSSLGSLQTLPLDVLKIDRSFVKDIEWNKSNYKIVEVITVLSKTMGYSIVAEGIENTENVKILQQMNCDFGQGYLFSKPVNSIEAEKLITHKFDIGK